LKLIKNFDFQKGHLINDKHAIRLYEISQAEA
jgi:hypothetical protein